MNNPSRCSRSVRKDAAATRLAPRRRWLAAVFVTLACNPRAMVEAPGRAAAAVQTFHASLDEGHFGDVYDAASPDFRKSVEREKFVALLAAVHRKLGKTKSCVMKTWRSGALNLKTFIDIVETAQFDQGAAEETFRFLIENDKAVLVAYNINSPDLITR
jgi:hypothetical protein